MMRLTSIHNSIGKFPDLNINLLFSQSIKNAVFNGRVHLKSGELKHVYQNEL
jgi:hypothetical protein